MPECKCPCEGCSLEMPDLCDNDPANKPTPWAHPDTQIGKQ